MIAEPVKRAATMTLEEFLNRPDTNQPMEYEDGEVITLPMPTPKHQRILRRLTRMIEDRIPSGEVFFAPLDVRLGGRVYQPDLLWVKTDGQAKVTDRIIEGAPDLVVEIVSPTSGKRDRRDKFGTYEQHGVSEYWIVEPEAELIEIYMLAEGKFRRHGAFGTEDTFTSPSLGADKPIEGNLIFAE